MRGESSVCRVTFRPEPTVVWDDAAVSALAPQLRNAIVGVCPAGVLGYSGADRSRIVVKRSDAILDFVRLRRRDLKTRSDAQERLPSNAQKVVFQRSTRAVGAGVRRQKVDDITALTRTLSPTGHSMIAASASDSAFLFQVEALGQMPVEDVVLCALNELKNKLGDLQGELHTIELGATQD
ncbi:hypothetical protein M885DRAFT_577556 [Pelagophyceae sp. CCMP2097]|nr:hypothetical protein M885DRAFT_577556 [Pelagophyceae sp. CCMP2097]